MYTSPRYLVAGDRGLTVEFGDSIDPPTNRRVRELFLALTSPGKTGTPAEERLRGAIVDLVPTYRSLLVVYDPLRISLAELQQAVASAEASTSSSPAQPPKVLEVPTCYGGEFGPDLAFVAAHAGLAEQDVVEIHAGRDYLVYMMGFSPGFPYLGGMSEQIAAPRLETPRTTIPAGSVGIAQTQTGIYPTESPGGWRLIGRTPIALFDAARHPPVLVEAGDSIRFVPVSRRDYDDLAVAVMRGAWEPRFLDGRDA